MKQILTFLVYGGFGAMMSICDIRFSNWRYWVFLAFMLGAGFVGGLSND